MKRVKWVSKADTGVRKSRETGHNPRCGGRRHKDAGLCCRSGFQHLSSLKQPTTHYGRFCLPPRTPAPLLQAIRWGWTSLPAYSALRTFPCSFRWMVSLWAIRTVLGAWWWWWWVRQVAIIICSQPMRSGFVRDLKCFYCEHKLKFLAILGWKFFDKHFTSLPDKLILNKIVLHHPWYSSFVLQWFL